MTKTTPLLDRNQSFAAREGHVGLSQGPALQMMVVTCMDHRVDPAQVLGIELGEALVLRNGGGRVNEEVVNEVAFIATLTETVFGDAAPPFEVAVIHHTGCGTGFLADPTFRATYAARIHGDEDTIAAQAVTDPHATVRADVALLLASPALPSRASVSGHVYDIDTGLVTTVEAARSHS